MKIYIYFHFLKRLNWLFSPMFSFMRPAALLSAIERYEVPIFEQRPTSEPTQLETPTDVQITVTSTTLDTSSRSDDTTIQDALISPDSDSSANISIGCIHRPDAINSGPHTYVSRSSCSNSIVSSDSLVSDTLDSKSCTVKNSESEIGRLFQNSFPNFK